MKFLKQIIDSFEPLFKGKDAKFKFFYPLYEAVSSFLFDPKLRPSSGPVIRDGFNIKRLMSIVVIGLLPATTAAVYYQGIRVLALIAVSYTVGGIVEVLFSLIRKEEVSEGFFVTGLLFPLTLPVTTPFWVVALGISFGVIFGKEVFGGTGYNIFNPALTSRCFVFLSWPAHLSPSGWLNPKLVSGAYTKYLHYGNIDAISSSTPLSIFSVEKDAQAVLEQFSIKDMFFGNISGSVGETSAILLILGGIFVLITKAGNWRIPTGMLLTITLLSFVLNSIKPNIFASTPIQLFCGGTMLGAFFMATDPVSAPYLNGSRWIYGILIGTMVVLIRAFTPLPEGVMFSILFANICAPIIDETVLKRVIKKERVYAKR